ncbi:glutamine synthetase family protein [Arthrobacter bambusae]|uniref:glutamine synthetase family protein n=1 Tax=Arthrobacter bambusae TaxID=1338426 RepID=UPI00277F6BD4|nr:glutamine synthetase family protein [Arthrobacter bambusae]MDQ0213324.1 glutamine synthetase [Arthrobacter bambusae]MDQ0237624.1 glutamine synthetase [Arthrobacter bambusae]
MNTTALTPPSTLEDCARIARENGIHTVECVFTDTWGLPRGKMLPIEQFLTGAGFSIANVAFSWDMRSDIHPTPWSPENSEYPDMHAVPDLPSFRVAGWTTGMATVMCDMHDPKTHERIPLDGRGMVKDTLKEFEALGYRVDMATELEFHLFTSDWQPISDKSYCYSLDRANELEPVIGAIRAALTASGITVEASNVEYGQAQVEINLKYGDAITMLDNTILFRHIVRQVARQHGYNATFMAKPINGGSGSGLHVHQSLWNSDGINVFSTKDTSDPVHSDLMRRYLSGLVAHQLELQAIALPTINDYKRIVDYSFSPTQVCWGLDNRLVGVRCITDAGPGTRLEVRWAAADANPYLVAQGYLQAGLDGLRNDLPLQPISVGDPHADPALQRVASTLAEAVNTFAGSPFAKAAFGEIFVDTYTAMQRIELAAFAAHVTDWEFNRYHDIL